MYFDKNTKEKYEQIAKTSKEIKMLESSFNYLREIPNRAQIEEITTSFASSLTQKTQKLLDGIEEYMDSSRRLSEVRTKEIINSYEHLEFIQEIPHLEIFMMSKKQALNNKVKRYLQIEVQTIVNFIKEIEDNNLVFDRLKRQIDKVDKSANRMERLFELCDKNNDNHLEEAASKIEDFLNDSKSNLISIRNEKLDLSKEESIKSMHILNKSLEIITALNLNDRNLE